MALRAKKPVIQEPRLKALVYASYGVGKSHFCCQFPDAYFIDTESLDHYPHLIKMLLEGGGSYVKLNELSEILQETKELISIEHNYKTLIIDSLSFPNGALSAHEVERLSKAGKEGTEFGANLAKGKRITFQLGILLSRLDMNVIVTSHEKTKFSEGKDAGETFDINEKMAYSLGTVLHLKSMGGTTKAFVEKSRDPSIKKGDWLDFSNGGYDTIKSLYGEEIFKRKTKSEILATPEQISEIKRLIQVLKYPEEETQKWLIKAGAQSFDEMNTEIIQKCIGFLNEKFLQPKAA